MTWDSLFTTNLLRVYQQTWFELIVKAIDKLEQARKIGCVNVKANFVKTCWQVLNLLFSIHTCVSLVLEHKHGLAKFMALIYNILS